MASNPNTSQHETDPSLPSARRHSASDATFKHVSPPKRAPSAALRMFSPVDSDDLEVETVLGDGGRGPRSMHGNFSRSRSTEHYDVASKIAQSPFRPSTVMTNLSRGNVQTTTPSIYPSLTVHQLAAQGEVVLLQQELQDGMDINYVDDNGFTALHWACANGQLGTVEFLIKNGGDISVAGNQGETPLLLASCYGFIEIVKFLLSIGVDVNYADEGGNTALMYAAYNNHATCITPLLEFGCDLTATNEDQLTAFDLAVAQGNKQAQQAMERYMLSLFDSSGS
ncbi:uncharacterized protein LOC143282047 [Babylonia areolata]|uniref:uncharacterized protein LOC143282047 n=1 Tax=Babylonia areolata TaxID=304850 RepID=UPI003FD5E4E9